MECFLPTRYLFWLTIISVILQGYTSRCCLEQERVALLQLKSYFMSLSRSAEFTEYLSDILSSWNGDGERNCCMWKRVKCNRATQHIIGLSLDGLMTEYDYNGEPYYNVLNVTFLKSFGELRSLNLSYNAIHRLVGPEVAANLKHLKVLDLSWNNLNGSLLGLGNLKQLQVLHLRGNNINESLLGQELVNLKQLKVLDLGANNLGRFLPVEVVANLKHLEVLDLRWNNLNRSLLGLGNLKQLQMLHLSENNLNESLLGQELVNLKQLKVLDLGTNNLDRFLLVEVVANLKHLEVLDLSWNNLNGSLLGLCELNNLRELYLNGNSLSHNLPKCLGNLTSLRILDLSDNSFTGVVASIITNLRSLSHLSLSDNSFLEGISITSLLNHSMVEHLFLSHSGLQVIDDSLQPPTFQLRALGLSDCNLNMPSRKLPRFLLHQQSLEVLDLSHNSLVGSFPTWLLQNNSGVRTVILRNNSFEGILSLPDHGNHSTIFQLDISKNQFSGQFPKNIGMVLPRLQFLNASENNFQAEVPTSIGNMTGLRVLDLSNNFLGEEVPRQLFTDCQLLSFLKLSYNSLQGDIIPEYMNFTDLSVLYLDNNHFSGTLPRKLLMSNYHALEVLDISNNQITGGIPSWLGNFSMLNLLSISGNQLVGQIPCDLWNLYNLQFLDMSSNKLTGMIPSCFNLTDLRSLQLCNNFLMGPIPSALSRSIHLRALDLSNNQLSGGIPSWINHLSRLKVLVLGHNWLEGELPSALCHLEQINIMDLSSNSIFGTIPACLANMAFGVITPDDWSRLFGFDISSRLHDIFEEIYEVIDEEQVRFLTKSRYLAYKGRILELMSGLDLSCNRLTGEIPKELGHLNKIHALNLSHNRLYGPIPNSFSMLGSVESLDLSYNNLSGAVPFQLAEVTSLEIFNLSYNNLSGRVPETGQFANFDESNYKGNPFLCGFVGKPCTTPTKDDTKDQGDDGADTAAGFDWGVFFWSFGMTYVTLLLAFAVVLWINPHWRRAWFVFIDLHMLWWLN